MNTLEDLEEGTWAGVVGTRSKYREFPLLCKTEMKTVLLTFLPSLTR